MHPIYNILILLIVAVATVGCNSTAVFEHHSTTAATEVEHIPEDAIDHKGDLGSALKKGILYRAIIVDSVWEWGFLEPVPFRCRGQCRYGYFGGAGLSDWSIVLSFDRRDIAPGLLGSVTDGWFELAYSDPQLGVHVYRWRDSRRVFYRYPHYAPPVRWRDHFRVINKALKK